MASEGPKSPATTVDDASVGTVAWSTPNNSQASDNSYATATLVSPTQTHYLKATNFGFSIPSGATIDGIVVEAEVSEIDIDGQGNDYRARIVKGGTIGATDKANATTWGTTDTYLSHGGITDLWGETWTAADINAANFGFALSAQLVTGTSLLPQIDHIRITVYYSQTAGTLLSPIPQMEMQNFYKEVLLTY